MPKIIIQYEQRKIIEKMLSENYSLQDISDFLGCPFSTIYYEFNRLNGRTYNADEAEKDFREKQAYRKAKDLNEIQEALKNNVPLKDIVETHISTPTTVRKYIKQGMIQVEDYSHYRISSKGKRIGKGAKTIHIPSEWFENCAEGSKNVNVVYLLTISDDTIAVLTMSSFLSMFPTPNYGLSVCFSPEVCQQISNLLLSGMSVTATCKKLKINKDSLMTEIEHFHIPYLTNTFKYQICNVTLVNNNYKLTLPIGTLQYLQWHTGDNIFLKYKYGIVFLKRQRSKIE